MTLGTPYPHSFEEFLAWQRDLTPEQREVRERERDAALRDEIGQRNAAHRVAMAQRLSNLGPRFAERTLDSYDCPPGDPMALEIARDIVAVDGQRGVWLCGGKGTGKTHLAAGIVNALTNRAIAATFVSVIALMDQLKANYDRNGKPRVNQVDVIHWLAAVDVLVLDDIDKAEFTSYTSQRLFALINQRYEQGGYYRRRPVIVTSNHMPADIAIRWRKKGLDELIGDAIFDRFRELCGQFVRVEGESYRERMMQERLA